MRGAKIANPTKTIIIKTPNFAVSGAFTPDDIYEGNLPTGHVVLYDDDHFYLGGVLAEHCKKEGCEVTLITLR